MKISPLAASAGPNAVPTGIELGKSAGSDRVARAKAILTGQATPASEPIVEVPQAQAAEPNVRRIKMITQQSTNRHEPASEITETPIVEVAPTESNTLAQVEQAQGSEATQQMSPQYAELAKAKRALQVKEREIAAREAALAAKPPTDGQVYTHEQIKANALRVLTEAGVSYDQLTQELLSQNQAHPGLEEVRSEIKALKEGLEKGQIERDQMSEQQVLRYIREDVDQLIAQGDEYEAVREAGYAPKVVELIHRVFKKEGKMLDTSEAAKLIENEIIEESLKFARLKKVQGRLTPAEAQQQQPAKPSERNSIQIRTLTNRDGASPASLSRRERAIAAAEGRLKR